MGGIQAMANIFWYWENVSKYNFCTNRNFNDPITSVCNVIFKLIYRNRIYLLLILFSIRNMCRLGLNGLSRVVKIESMHPFLGFYNHNIKRVFINKLNENLIVYYENYCYYFYCKSTKSGLGSIITEIICY